MMVMEEVTKPANAHSSIFITRLGSEDLIYTLNTSLLSIREAATCCFLEVINNKVFLFRINLLALACWCQFWRTTINTGWKCRSCNTKLAGNGILAWWWFLVPGVEILLHSLLKVIFFFLKCLLWLYSCWVLPWHVYWVVIRILWGNLDSLIPGSPLKIQASKHKCAFISSTEWSWHSCLGCHALMGLEWRVQCSEMANQQ